MLKITRAMLFTLPVVFVLTGCQAEQNATKADASPELSNLANEVIQNLAVRLDAPPGEVVLVREEDVTWRDGSLGCPQEGMMYTQALVEGMLIVLRVEGRDYQYHSGHGRAPFYCENPVSPVPKSSVD